MTPPNEPNQPVPNHPSQPTGARRPQDPSASPEAADHLTALAHELGNMLDGSMRWLGLIAESLSETGRDGKEAYDRLEITRDQVLSVHSQLERMSGIVDVAMRGKATGIGSPLLGGDVAVSLGEAIDHAVDVVTAHARVFNTRIELDIDREAGLTHAGPLYSVILNGLQNAIESIARCTQDDEDAHGLIQLSAKIVEDLGQRWIVIEIVDDGHGLPLSSDQEWPFRHGFTIKGEGGGVGLSICRRIVHEAGGSIELVPREDRKGEQREGAILRIRCRYTGAEGVGETDAA
ncbi:MAG: ATP-binding protein [Phycisphaerales bacterium JB059]